MYDKTRYRARSIDKTIDKTLLKDNKGMYSRKFIRILNNRSDYKVSNALWPTLDKSGTQLHQELDRNTLRTIISVSLMLHKVWEGVRRTSASCQEKKELETIEHIIYHWPWLYNLRLWWFGIQFHDWLGNIPDCGFANIIVFSRKLDG